MFNNLNGENGIIMRVGKIFRQRTDVLLAPEILVAIRFLDQLSFRIS